MHDCDPGDKPGLVVTSPFSHPDIYNHGLTLANLCYWYRRGSFRSLLSILPQLPINHYISTSYHDLEFPRDQRVQITITAHARSDRNSAGIDAEELYTSTAPTFSMGMTSSSAWPRISIPSM